MTENPSSYREMAKVFLTCFAPYNALSSDEVDVGLISSLSVDLQRLQMSLEENPLSLSWCCEAVSCIKKAHSNFLVEIERYEAFGSWEAIEMVDEYMSATLDILDLCNLLRSAVSSLDKYRMMVDIILKRLKDAAFSSKIELEKLETENLSNYFDVNKLRDMDLNKKGLSKVKMKTRNNMYALQVIRSTMLIISLFIFFCVLHPIPIKIDRGFYAQMRNFDTTLNSIQKLITSFCKMFENAQSLKGSVLVEKKMIEDAFKEFKEQVASSKVSVDEGKLEEHLEKMKKRSLKLKEGVDGFESIMNELFENVIEGRKRVINHIQQQSSMVPHKLGLDVI